MAEPQGVLVTTPFWLYPDHQHLWKPRYDPMGGMHVIGRSIVLEMARRGFPARVMTMAPPGVPKDLQVTENVIAHARRLPVLPIPSKLEGYFGLVGAWAKATLAYVVRHREELRREIGLVDAHCDGSGSAPAYAYAAARVLDVPLVLHLYSCRSLTQHPTTMFERVSDPVAKTAERTVIRRAQAVLTLTEVVRQQVRDQLGVPDERLALSAHLPHEKFEEYDTPELRAELRRRFGLDDRPIVLYIGRISSEKGVQYLIRAAADVLEQRRCRVVILGDGPLRGEMEALAAELGIADDVVVTGFMPLEQLPSMITLSSMAVLPSEYEELGLVILEFMLMRRPVIAHDVSGVHKLIRHERTGLLTPRADPPRLAEAILRLLDDPELGRRMADEAAPIPHGDYSLRGAGARLEDIYRTVLKESR